MHNINHTSNNGRTLNTLVLPFVILAFFCVACDSSSHSDTIVPAPLIERGAGLYPEEFRRQQNTYNTAAQQLQGGNHSAEIFTTLANVFIYEARVTGKENYYYDATVRLVDEALVLHKDHLELLSLKVRSLLGLHRFEEARVLASTLIARSPGTAIFYGMLCDACVNLGQTAEAVAAIDAMMSLRPGVDAYARAAQLREIYRDTVGAIHAMHLAVQAAQPGSHDAAWTRTQYGNLLRMAGREVEAIEQFTMARLERKEFPPAVAALVGATIDHGHHQGGSHNHRHGGGH